MVKLLKHYEKQIIADINILQNESVYLKLEINVTLKFLVWWRMVDLYIQDSSQNYKQGSEKF